MNSRTKSWSGSLTAALASSFIIVSILHAQDDNVIAVPGDIHPANKGFVEAQMKRINDIQARLTELKTKQRDEFPGRLKGLETQISALVAKMQPGKDEEYRRSSEAISRLKSEIEKLSSSLKQMKPETFQTYQDFVKMDGMRDEISRKSLELARAERNLHQRTWDLACKDQNGAKLVEEAKKLNAEANAVTQEISRLQPHRDTVKRQVYNMINSIKNPSESKEQPPGITLEVAPPKDAAARQALFERRNTPEGIKELGIAFFREMDLSTPGLENVSKLVAAGDYAGALEEYKKYFFTKLTSAQPKASDDDVAAGEEDEDAEGDEGDEGEGQAAAGAEPAIHGAIRPPSPGQVSEAMAGIVLENIRPDQKDAKDIKVAANMGRPGSINWIFCDYAPSSTPPEKLDIMREFCTRQFMVGHTGSALFNSYVLGGDKAQLVKWCDIADDWAMNWQRDIDGSRKLVRGYNILIGCEVGNFIGRLANAARMRPDFARDMPATTLARLLLAVNSEYIPPAIRMGRSGTYNFRIMMLNNMIPASLKMQEFLVHQWALREACRLMELNWTHKIRRDGANSELANAGHEDTDGSLLHPFNAILEAKPRSLELPPFWEKEFKDNVAANARYWIHGLKQDGRAYRLSTSPLADKFTSGIIKVDLIKDEPEVQKRLWKVFYIGTPQEDPKIRSESMCFAGYYYLREGWDSNDYFLYMHCINQPVCSGRDDNNGFILSGHGINLQAPPVFVDGRTQNSYYNLVRFPGGKANFSVSARKDLVKNTRFHTSDSFDLAEGIYDGVYQYHQPGAKSKFYDVIGSFGYEDVTKRAMGKAEREGKPFADDPIKDVKHTRQIISLNGKDIYIVTDFVESSSKHEFKQDYRIPTPMPTDNWTRRMELMQKEKVDPVKINRTDREISLDNAGFAGLEMKYFGAMPLSMWVDEQFPTAVIKKANGNLGAIFKAVGTKKMPKGSPIPFGRHAAVTWTGEGKQSLTTVIAPENKSFSAERSEILSRLKPLDESPGVSGFSGSLPDGTPVIYAASNLPMAHSGGGITAQSRVLLLSGKNGIALDCSKIAFNGKEQMPSTPDFEFSIADGGLRIDKPIYRPIAPVDIEPETNIFVGKVQVGMNCPSPGVDIRYTLDGSNPRHDSTLYTAPFSVDKTCFLKARAFRKGMTYTPWTEDGTYASVASWAVLEKRSLNPATAHAGKTIPGLAYEYYEGPWTKIMAEGPTCPAKKKGIVQNVLDVSPREGANPFGFRYEGYIEVPEDGVYTFHAPREYVFPDMESGYDLRVYVDGKEWYPETRWHAHGTWSTPLARGKHRFKVVFTDLRYRPHKVDMMWGFPNPEFTWKGSSPELMISGPGLKKQLIAPGMLSTDSDLK